MTAKDRRAERVYLNATRRRDQRPHTKGGGPTFRAQDRQCATCIYRKGSPLDLAALEAAVADRMAGHFAGHRTCHHSEDVCCRGFWDRHKDRFDVGQLAQRLGLVRFVHVDNQQQPPTRGRETP